MESLEILYEQYYNLIEKIQENTSNELRIDILQYGITKVYYENIDKATGLLQNFYDKYLMIDKIRNTVCERLSDNHPENVKFCILIDIMRCYDGLGHPTSFTTPEGIALMILISKILRLCEISSYEQLRIVNSATVSLIDIIPYISECSNELGNRYSLFLSEMLEKEYPDIDRLYRILLYNLCKRIAEVDGEISISEKEWLNEITKLNDDDPDNDIDVSDV